MTRTGILVPALAILTAACGTTRQEEKQMVVARQAQIEIKDVAAGINNVVQGAARTIKTGTTDREVRRRSTIWQMRVLDATRRSALQPDPRVVFLDYWTMAIQMYDYFATGDAQDFFGDQQEVAVAASASIIDSIERRASELLNKKQFESARAQARDFATANPIRGGAMRPSNRPGDLGSNRSSIFSTILNVPSDVFALGGGVKDTAQSISEVAASADRVATIAEDLPTVLRWQLELMSYDVDENRTVQTALGSIESIGKTAEAMPDRLRDTAVATLKEVEASQPEFRKTLAEGRGIVDEAHGAIRDASEALGKVRATTETVAATTEHLTAAGKAWEGTIRELNLLVNPPEDPNEPPSPPAPPFDVKDAAATAEWLTKAATELRGTIVEVRGLVESKDIDARLEQVDAATRSALDHTTTRAGDLVDRITWRAGLLIVVFFASLLGYRVARARLVR